jgi:hypothetical protein
VLSAPNPWENRSAKCCARRQLSSCGLILIAYRRSALAYSHAVEMPQTTVVASIAASTGLVVTWVLWFDPAKLRR